MVGDEEEIRGVAGSYGSSLVRELAGRPLLLFRSERKRSRGRPARSGDEALVRVIREGDFDAQVARAGLPVLVVFTAQWCGPCRWLHPHLEDLGSRTENRLLIFEVDVDRSPELAARFRIGSVPTVVLLRGGEEVDRSVGVEPERLRGWARGLDTSATGAQGRRNVSKKERKEAILDLIRTRRIGSQEALRQLLKERGIQATQATLSRDMTELRLVKVMGADGGAHYSLPEPAEQAPSLEALLPALFVSAEAAENLMVVRTTTGGAQAVGLAIDSEEWTEVLGTVAGDDTVLVILRDAAQAAAVGTRLEAIAGKANA